MIFRRISTDETRRLRRRGSSPSDQAVPLLPFVSASMLTNVFCRCSHHNI
jgi:hypothetical protein